MNEWAVWCGGVVMAGNVIASNEEEEGLGLADPAQHSTLGHMVMPITIMTIAIAVELVIVPIEVCVCVPLSIPRTIDLVPPTTAKATAQKSCANLHTISRHPTGGRQFCILPPSS